MVADQLLSCPLPCCVNPSNTYGPVSNAAVKNVAQKTEGTCMYSRSYSTRVSTVRFSEYVCEAELRSRKKDSALITDPELCKKHVLKMVQNQALSCLSGKQIPCEIDSVCIHGDNISSLATAKSIKENLLDNSFELKPLDQMKKFI